MFAPWLRTALKTGSPSMRSTLIALCFAAATATSAPSLAAQGVQPPSIAAPAPLTRLPIAVSTAPAGTLRIRCHSYEGAGISLARPQLLLLNGRLLGVQSDGSIDHEAARRELSQVDGRSVASIERLKGAEAIRRFGPAAREGAFLFRTIPVDSSRRDITKRAGNPP
jgi:hypothetical protein